MHVDRQAGEGVHSSERLSSKNLRSPIRKIRNP
jgi:hypothetical protein